MDEHLVEIREQQKASWDKFSPGWKKWDALMMEFLHPVGEAIIQEIAPAGEAHVLDVASGTGEPGLTIATMLNGGRVVITDLSGEMLEVAKEHAARRGIQNIETHACDVCELPFPDNTFDAISCRFGFMFFPDMQLAANEMVRVLKPGGRLATSVWNVPEKNFWITSIMGTIARHVDVPPPPPGAPGMFRCASNDVMTEIFSRSALSNIAHREISTSIPSGTAERFWDMMTEVGAPIVAALSQADATLREKIRVETIAAITERYGSGAIALDGSAVLYSGLKPGA